jgi:hypothetical protein
MEKKVPCSLCDKTSCTVQTEKNCNRYLVNVSGFSGTCQHGVDEDIYFMLERMLEIENWRSAHRLNREFVLGYCKKM